MTTATNPVMKMKYYSKMREILMKILHPILKSLFDDILPSTDLPDAVESLKKNRHRVQFIGDQKDALYVDFKQNIVNQNMKSEDFDISLLIKLIRNADACYKNNLNAPANFRWDELPPTSDKTLHADIVRIGYYRNKLSHEANGVLEISDFEDMVTDFGGIIERRNEVSNNYFEELLNDSDMTYVKDTVTRIEDQNRHYRHKVDKHAVCLCQYYENKGYFEDAAFDVGGCVLLARESRTTSRDVLRYQLPGDGAHLIDSLCSTSKVARVYGENGSGKTFLLRKLIFDWMEDEAYMKQFGHVFYVRDCRGETCLIDVLADLVTCDNGQRFDMASFLRVRDKKILILLDDVTADEIDEINATLSDEIFKDVNIILTTSDKSVLSEHKLLGLCKKQMQQMFDHIKNLQSPTNTDFSRFANNGYVQPLILKFLQNLDASIIPGIGTIAEVYFTYLDNKAADLKLEFADLCDFAHESWQSPSVTFKMKDKSILRNLQDSDLFEIPGPIHQFVKFKDKAVLKFLAGFYVVDKTVGHVFNEVMFDGLVDELTKYGDLYLIGVIYAMQIKGKNIKVDLIDKTLAGLKSSSYGTVSERRHLYCRCETCCSSQLSNVVYYLLHRSMSFWCGKKEKWLALVERCIRKCRNHGTYIKLCKTDFGYFGIGDNIRDYILESLAFYLPPVLYLSNDMNEEIRNFTPMILAMHKCPYSIIIQSDSFEMKEFEDSLNRNESLRGVIYVSDDGNTTTTPPLLQQYRKQTTLNWILHFMLPSSGLRQAALSDDKTRFLLLTQSDGEWVVRGRSFVLGEDPTLLGNNVHRLHLILPEQRSPNKFPVPGRLVDALPSVLTHLYVDGGTVADERDVSETLGIYFANVYDLRVGNFLTIGESPEFINRPMSLTGIHTIHCGVNAKFWFNLAGVTVNNDVIIYRDTGFPRVNELSLCITQECELETFLAYMTGDNSSPLLILSLTIIDIEFDFESVASALKTHKKLKVVRLFIQSTILDQTKREIIKHLMNEIPIFQVILNEESGLIDDKEVSVTIPQSLYQEMALKGIDL